jgi:hypothetical protein
MNRLFFLIEDGLALSMIQGHIAECKRVDAENKAIADELGITEGRTDRTTGALTAAVFPGQVPTGWTKPDKQRCSRPIKGTEWYQRFQSQVGHGDPSSLVSQTFGIPTDIEYDTESGGWGSRYIGGFMNSCGLLWLSHDGPYAMWIPDVEAEVRLSTSRGELVKEPAKSFKPTFNGCRKIQQEEWEILQLQRKLEKKQEREDAVI